MINDPVLARSPPSQKRMFTVFAHDVGMPVRQPFRAVPITLGKRYRREAKAAKRRQVAKVLAGAVLIGAVVGTGSIAASQDGLEAIGSAARPLAVSLGLIVPAHHRKVITGQVVTRHVWPALPPSTSESLATAREWMATATG